MSFKFGQCLASHRDGILDALCNHVRVLIVTVSLLAIFICGASPCQAAKWSKLEPEAGVSLEIPGDVKPIKKGKTVERYESMDEKYLYIVTTESSNSSSTLDEILESFKEQLAKGDLTKSSSEQDAHGKVWEGKRLVMSNEKGDSAMSVQIARDNQSQKLICLSTSAPLDSAEAKQFFESLRVDSEAISAHRKELADKFFKRLCSPSSLTDWTGIGISVVGIMAAFFGWLFLVITAFRTSIIWGLLVSFTGGFGILLFLVFNPKRAFAPFFLQLFGIIAIGVGMAIMLPNMVGGS